MHPVIVWFTAGQDPSRKVSSTSSSHGLVGPSQPNVGSESPVASQVEYLSVFALSLDNTLMAKN